MTGSFGKAPSPGDGPPLLFPDVDAEVLAQEAAADVGAWPNWLQRCLIAAETAPQPELAAAD